MKYEMVFTFFPLVLMAILFQFMPLFTRHGIFFSATVEPGFPLTEEGRSILRSFRMQAVLWTLAAIVVVVALGPARPQYAAVLPTLLLLAGVSYTYWRKFRLVHDRFGLRRPEVRAANLSLVEDRGGIRLWLALPPFAAIAVIALCLKANWDRIPAEFPVHWGANGEPNGWARHDARGVYSPLVVAVLMNASFLALAWALRRISRKGTMRDVTVTMLQVLVYPVTFALGTVSLLPLVKLPIWMVPAVMVVFVAGLLLWSYQKITAPHAVDETPDPENDAYWKAGVIYYNPNDPAIFVSKRVGIGYTVNFANKVSWLVMAGMLLFGLLPALLLKGK